ncbi:MAG: bifunctional phosphoribosyl-AMP cyclohydrolase/phosphoribosyl-ATP diphosphatase HisIE [Deltaproteobacteria bacterium]|nr:bifunctional phosphoribosyl-AMP cyclohydrolase/phosphoribosyl-ATP diphosphatase HisIE [Deltaproteobacteria bacterium]
MDLTNIKFDDKGLVPAIAQDSETGAVLMLAYMNEESLTKTIETGLVHYWSRSRQELWQKGKTSGNIQELRELLYDCDGDTLLVKVKQAGPACHTNQPTCFFNPLVEDTTSSDKSSKGKADAEVLNTLYRTIIERKNATSEESYVASLYQGGINKIALKIHEEAAELINAAKKEGPNEVINELCDLWFHTLVLLGKEDISISRVYSELKRRFGTSGHDEKASRK